MEVPYLCRRSVLRTAGGRAASRARLSKAGPTSARVLQLLARGGGVKEASWLRTAEIHNFVTLK